MTTLKEYARIYGERFQSISSTPYLDADILLHHATGLSRARLYAYGDRRLTQGEQKAFQSYCKRRLNGEPVAYILGKKSFFSMEFKVTPDVLVPRPETESLVSCVLSKGDPDRKLSLADLGTGSGAIALSLAALCINWTVDATDLSEAALNVARENSRHYALTDRVRLFEGSWFEPLGDHQYDIIVCNPPYIASDDPHLDSLALRHEPRLALVSKDNGLADLRHIIRRARAHLNPQGWLMLEHGHDQQAQVIQWMHECGYCSAIGIKDLSGINRIVMGQL